ncbi:uncharacterized protein V1516DRAFT_672321 [Lipomyces oligophaga]|uniref:uncharacterized protein n=1 Tax=Lipomyces oligophaga TaxID=45792 RepID=UPI0034CF39BE
MTNTWDNWTLSSGSRDIPSSPPPTFADSTRSDSARRTYPLHNDYNVRSVTWSDLHPHDESRIPPAAFPDGSGTTPYLGLSSRLSQVWLNRWTVISLLVLAKLLLSSNSLYSGLDSAKQESLSACRQIEVAGSSLVSTPYYISTASNELIASSVETAVEALNEVLDLLIVGVEEIIVFVIEMLTSTYTCLITLVINGAANVVINATESIISFVNSSATSINEEINSVVDTFNSALSGVESTIESIANLLTDGSVDWPTLEIPTVNITIDPDINASLEELRDNLPDFDEVKNATESVIRYPFEKLKTLIDDNYSNYTFDRSVLSVPAKEELTFCSSDPIIEDFFDELTSLIHGLVKSIVIGLSVVAVIALFPMGYLDMRGWKKLRQRVYLLSRSLRRTDRNLDPIDTFMVGTSPWSNFLGLYVSRPLKSVKKQVLLRWFLAYITYPPVLVVFSLGVASLIGAILQLIVVNKLHTASPELAQQVGEFAGVVVNTVEDKAVEWADSTNMALNTTENNINDELFTWVLSATSSVNNTLNTFVDETMQVLNDVFGDTVLYDTVVDVLNCLIFLKIAGIEKGLTWAYDNAHISLPRVNETLLTSALLSVTNSSSNSTVSNSTSSSSTIKTSSTINSTSNTSSLNDAAIESLSAETTETILSALETVECVYRKGIRIELYFAGVFLGIWGLIVLFAGVRYGVVSYSLKFAAVNKAIGLFRRRHGEEEAASGHVNDPTMIFNVPRPLVLPHLHENPFEPVRECTHTSSPTTSLSRRHDAQDESRVARHARVRFEIKPETREKHDYFESDEMKGSGRRDSDDSSSCSRNSV